MEASPEAILQAQIDKLVNQKTAGEAFDSLTPDQRQKFLEAYYLQENLDYDNEIKVRINDGMELINNEIDKYKQSGVITPDLVDGVMLVSKATAINAMIDKVQSVHESLRVKLKEKNIKDFMTTVTFQMGMGALVMEYNEMLSDEITKNCNERKIDVEAFMKEAIPLLTGDMSIFFEIDNYYGLKAYEKMKDQKITEPQAEEYIKKTTDYSKMVVNGELNPQTVIVFPNLMNHYLYNETGLENVQVLDFVMQKVKQGQKNNEEFFKQLFEEIYYIERGRKIITDIFQMQMQMMDQMMASNNSGDSQLFQPNWNAGPMPDTSQLSQGFDPMMMNSGFGNLNSNDFPGMPGMQGMPGMPGMQGMPNMEEMAKAMENLDFSKFAEFFPEMDQMMREFAANMGANKEDEKKE